MKNIFATRLKSKRLEKKLSQTELASGICEQAQISRMEQGKYIPGAEIVYLLSKKLQVQMEYFFEESVTEELSPELLEFKKLSKELLRNNDYKSLKYLYDIEVSKAAKFTLSDQIYFDWIRSILLFYYENKKQKGIDLLLETLRKISDNNIVFLNLSNTLLVFYFETNQFENFSSMYSTVSSTYKNIIPTTIEEFEVILKFRYNICRYLWLSDKDNECLEEVLSAISFSKQYKFWYLLPDLYCILGNISERFSTNENLKEYYQNALFFYKLDNNENMIIKTEKHIRETYGD